MLQDFEHVFDHFVNTREYRVLKWLPSTFFFKTKHIVHQGCFYMNFLNFEIIYLVVFPINHWILQIPHKITHPVVIS